MIDYESIGGGLKFRLAAFIVAMAAMIALIAWAGQSAWRRGSELRAKLTAVQSKSFEIGDHFQQSILELNNAALQYGVSHDTNDWARFDAASGELDRWIDAQRRSVSTSIESSTLAQVDQAYDQYLSAARGLEARVRAEPHAPTRLAEFATFQKQSQELLKLGLQLARAHDESTHSFLAQSMRSLAYFRWLVVSSLTLLLVAGGGLAVVVYGELIAPLRVKLVQSQTLAERQEKLASLGMLAAGVAHEIRNPLTAIKAWLFIQQKHLQPGTPEYADAELIGNEISRLEGIVRDVLLFARPSDPRLTLVLAGEILREVCLLMAPQLERAQIRLELQEVASALIQIDPSQIKQVLINLIQNAADSIGRDGLVSLRARLDTKRLSDRPVEVVILEVADTGKGIPPEVERRLFDPFFTTKETGTGLGLSIAARIVEKHGGALQYQTQVNRGSTFGIVLPRAPGDATKSLAES